MQKVLPGDAKWPPMWQWELAGGAWCVECLSGAFILYLATLVYLSILVRVRQRYSTVPASCTVDACLGRLALKANGRTLSREVLGQHSCCGVCSIPSWDLQLPYDPTWMWLEADAYQALHTMLTSELYSKECASCLHDLVRYVGTIRL